MTRMQQVAENAAVYGIWTGIVLILLTPFVVTPDTIFPFVVGKAVYSRSLIECVFGIWAILALFRPAYRPPRSWLLLLLAVNVGVSVLAACFGVSPQRSFWSTYERMQGVVDLIHWFAFAVVLASVLRTERDWRIVLNLNVACGLIMAGLALCLYYFIDFPFFSSYTYYYWGEYRQAGVDPTGRSTATVGNALSLGMYTLVNCVIAAGLLAQSFISASTTSRDSRTLERTCQKQSFLQNDKRNLLTTWIGMCFWSGTLIFGFWTLTLTGSRAVLFSFFTTGGFLAAGFLSWVRTRFMRFVIVWILGLFACATVLSLLLTFRPYTLMTNNPFETFMLKATSVETFSNPLLKRLIRPEVNDSMGGDLQWKRMKVLSLGFYGFLERPLLGWGPENFIAIFSRYLSKPTDHFEIHDHSHNRIVEESVTKGILGLSSYLALWIYALLIVLRTAKFLNVRRQPHLLFVGAALMGCFIQSQLGVNTASLSLQYFLLLAFVARLETSEEKSPMVGSRQVSFLYAVIRTVIVIVSISTLVGTGFLINRAIYSAAFSIKRSTDALNGPSQSINLLKQAISQFQPLANTPRGILFSNGAHLWAKLRLRNVVEAERLLRLIDNEATAALADEPENRRIQSSLAETYGVIASCNTEYKDTARRYSELALGTDFSPKQETAPRDESRSLHSNSSIYQDDEICGPESSRPFS